MVLEQGRVGTIAPTLSGDTALFADRVGDGLFAGFGRFALVLRETGKDSALADCDVAAVFLDIRLALRRDVGHCCRQLLQQRCCLVKRVFTATRNLVFVSRHATTAVTLSFLSNVSKEADTGNAKVVEYERTVANDLIDLPEVYRQ